VRVIPNKFAALAGASEPQRREAGPLFCEMDGVGAHEVIIETPVHNRVMPLMTDAEIERVLQAYQARFQALRGDPRVRYIIIFKNHGEQAGTSLEHPHSQLVATPIAPLRVRCTYEVAIRHYDDTGRYPGWLTKLSAIMRRHFETPERRKAEAVSEAGVLRP
jgi:UDPglucose--hexose-1-phosphate uridylyltransferase